MKPILPAPFTLTGGLFSDRRTLPSNLPEMLAMPILMRIVYSSSATLSNSKHSSVTAVCRRSVAFYPSI